MSEAISAENIEEVLRQRLFDLTATVDTQEVSHVAEVGDGIAHIFGLKSAMAGELLEFTSSATGETVYGLAQNLDRDEVGAVLFGNVDSIKATPAVLLAVLWTSPSAEACSAALSIRLASLSTARATLARPIVVPLSLKPPVSSTAPRCASRFRPGFSL